MSRSSTMPPGTSPPGTLPPGAELEPETVLERSGSNFRTAFVCLDAERRDGMTAIYAFCRVADDAADDAPDAETGARHIAFWRDELRVAAEQRASTPVGRALGDVMSRFGTPRATLDALLDGVTMDLEPSGFADEPALRRYCDCVASAVGRACLPVLGATGELPTRYADSLGQALQLTNILRDLRADAESERVYVPETWLEELGVEREWLRGGGPAAAVADGGPIARLRGRLVERAEAEFERARAALGAMPRSHRRALVPARIMGAVYGSLLRRLAAQGGRLEPGRTRVPRSAKLWLALQVFLGVRA